MNAPTASTIGELRASSWIDRSLKDELRDNLTVALRTGVDPFPGIRGYAETVLPSLERALIAGHDIILLGERGQAKTRLIRSLVALLDEWTPVIEGCEINDSPFRPVCAHCRDLISKMGDDTPIRWLARDRRYAEKLATPDIAVADLIGDIDPIRVAEGRYLGDEKTIHYGLVPRTNRGIFAINELPDLPERIQVGLLNILEERDVQIRGYQVRLDLDLLLVATANPEDYTNRGRIISPLKDRFGSEIRTHYPMHALEEVAIVDQEMRMPNTVPVTVPSFMKQIVVEITRLARRSPHVNQRSGVSVRFSIGNTETIVASALRRAIRRNEQEAVPRISDLSSILQSSTGRLEFEAFEEGREDEILGRMVRQATLDVFRKRLAGLDVVALQKRFEEGLNVESGDLVSSAELLASIGSFPGLGKAMTKLGVESESPAMAASVAELILEGMHLSKRLNKASSKAGSVYSFA
ncbi:MAG: sigma 54-interacting transcriptional regulator [Actinomycetota bacterium]